MLKVEDWAEIRRLHFAEGLGKQTIAKRLGIARNTVKAALANADPPAYRRRRRPSAVDPYEDQIRALLRDCNTMPATVIAERIGWQRGITRGGDGLETLAPQLKRRDARATQSSLKVARRPQSRVRKSRQAGYPLKSG